MATNGYTQIHGHKTAASPSWCDPVLQGSNTVEKAVSFTSAGDRIVIYATAADVVIVNDSDAVQVGYATLADISCVAYNETSGTLYIGKDGTGIYTLDLSSTDFQAAGGNLTASLSLDYTSATAPALYSNNVVSLVTWSDSSDNDWLAVACCDNGKTGADRICIVDTDGAAIYDSYSPTLAGDMIVKRESGKHIKFTSGNLICNLYDAESVSADNWLFDATGGGSIADNFTDNDMNGWCKYNINDTLTESNGALEGAITAAVDGSATYNNFTRTAFMPGNFDISCHFSIDDNGHPFSELASGREVSFQFGIAFLHEGLFTNYLMCYRQVEEIGTPTNNVVVYWEKPGGAVSYSHAITYEDMYFRITRSGSTVNTYYKQYLGDDWTALSEFTDCPTSPAMPVFFTYNTDGNWEWKYSIYDLYTGWSGDETAYSASLPKGAITDFDVIDGTSVAETSTIAIGTSEGAWLIDTDESTEKSSESGGYIHGDYTTATGGGVHDVLSGASDAVTALCLSAGAYANVGARAAGNGELMVATTDGISAINLSNDSLAKHYTEDNSIGYGGVLLDDDVNEIILAGSYFIGTDTGGMWLTVDTDAPDDGTTWLHNHPGDYPVAATAKPTVTDFHHSELYRYDVTNGGGAGWEELCDDGFGGSGSIVEFPWTDLDTISYIDELANDNDGQYGYKWIHKDNSGNASSGDVEYAYIDDPVVTGVTAEDPDDASTARTRTRGVIVNVTAKGGATINCPNCVEWIKIKEGAVSSYDDVPYQRYESGKDYNFTLSSGNGTKTLYVRAYSQSLRSDNTGTSDGTCTINLQEVATGSTSWPTRESMMLAYDYCGDYYDSLNSSGTDSSFPATNVVDDDLNKKWKADSQTAYLEFDLTGSPYLTKTVRFVAICGHNFNFFGSGYLTLGIQYKGPSTGGSYVNVSVVSLQNNDPLVLRFGADGAGIACTHIKINMLDTTPTPPYNFEIGRVIIADNTTTVQPTANIAKTFDWGTSVNYTSLNQTSGINYGVNKSTNRRIQAPFNLLIQADRKLFFDAYEWCGLTKSAFFIGKPNLLPTTSVVSWDTSTDAERANNYVMYCKFADQTQMWSETVNVRSSGQIVLEEITE